MIICGHGNSRSKFSAQAVHSIQHHNYQKELGGSKPYQIRRLKADHKALPNMVVFLVVGHNSWGNLSPLGVHRESGAYGLTCNLKKVQGMSGSTVPVKPGRTKKYVHSFQNPKTNKRRYTAGYM
jgi:hypothetical protein